jgi:signal transduction histidine kinase
MTASAIALDAQPRLARLPNRVAISAVAAAGCAAAAFSLVLALTNEAIGVELGEPLIIALLADWIVAAYIFGGLVAWWRRPESRLGPLMIGAGFVMFVTTLTWSQNDVAYTAGQTLDMVAPVLFMHVFLAFPDGRLQTSFERALVAAAYATAIVLELVRMTLGGFGPHNLLELVPSEGASEIVRHVQLVTISALSLGAVGALAFRRWRSGPPLRRSSALLVDAFVLGLLMIAVLLTSATFEGPWVTEIRWATFITIGLAPVAFVLALLGARLAQSALGDLVVELRAEPGPADLRDALARALRDPSLELAYWLPDYRSYVDLDGRPLELPEEPGRTTTLIERNGSRVAALRHDAALADEPQLLGAVTAAAAIALENGRLQAELRARLEELRGSRARVIAAAQSERQRLERNLHDGAQQRLIALSLEISLLEERLGEDPDARARLAAARGEIAASLAELREVSHGLHPAVVSAHGLGVALEQLAARAAVPVRLTVNVASRLPEALEVAAYYLVSESLANVGKYARASSASVEITRGRDDVVVEIVDDGVGGVDESSGSGLRGLADRVEALGGRLLVWSPVGGGTRVRAEIPCER